MAAPHLDTHGLLAGASPSAAFYTQELDLQAADKLLITRGLLWEAAESDAAARGVPVSTYIASVERAACAFIDRGELFDRADTMGTLGTLMGARKGEFVLFLGGMDVGKSHMLRTLTETLRAQDRRVVVVSARKTGSDLVAGIISALQPDPSFFEAVRSAVPQRFASMAAAAANALASGSGAVVSAALSPTALRPLTLPELLDGFILACENDSKFPVLILDEVNRALPSAPAEASASTLSTLHLLTQLSKEQRKMNVLIAASEHTEPFRLASLGFKTQHMTETVIACEVPPAEMYKLVTETWGCGPALAQGLLAVYGGHVWQTHLALGTLAREKAAFKAIAGFSPATIDGVVACVKASRSADPAMVGLEDMLRSLAIHGYIGVADRKDPRAELLSVHNVGCVVSACASAPGVPPEAWRSGSMTVLTVASHGMRLVLAHQLSRSADRQ
jgi:hypothetical protein